MKRAGRPAVFYPPVCSRGPASVTPNHRSHKSIDVWLTKEAGRTFLHLCWPVSCVFPAATPVIQRHQQIRGVVGHRRNDQHARIRELGAERRQIDHRVTRYCLVGLKHAEEVVVTLPATGERDARMK
jgi:hypothetical protein